MRRTLIMTCALAFAVVCRLLQRWIEGLKAGGIR